MIDVRNLLERPATPAVSIYMPVRSIARDPYKLGSHLKGLVRQAKSMAGDRHEEEMFAPIADLAGDQGPWRHAMEGLAVFLAPGFSRIEWLGFDPDSFVDVGDRFNLRPLMPMLEPSQGFLILTIDPKESRLYRAARFEHTPEEDHAFAETLADITRKTEVEANVGFHPTGPSPTTGGAPTPKYHSQGDSPPDYKQVELDEFVGQLAKAVDSHLSGAREPLVLVSDPNLLGMCREHLHYPHLVEEGVAKNPSGLTPEEIRGEALLHAQPALDAAREQAFSRLEELAGRHEANAATRSTDVVAAAEHARVDTAFVDPARPLWGRMKSREGDLDVSISGESERGPGDIDLVSVAIASTLSNGGQVFLAARGDMPPGDEPLCAVMRY
ncbi:host attachment protein [Minwuia thermotolerans]|uniref:Uncharacterized protein n=1 Tax=Minwuia thermotolerans TaxID=2056226 RepID=A0A2M9G587_9PROT|nr:host attachment protein [Minwuia thermotolerans]PJK30872.1 hypothetical protein CVT23_04485 [Minwuia thermotolerans]